MITAARTSSVARARGRLQRLRSSHPLGGREERDRSRWTTTAASFPFREYRRAPPRQRRIDACRRCSRRQREVRLPFLSIEGRKSNRSDSRRRNPSTRGPPGIVADSPVKAGEPLEAGTKFGLSRNRTSTTMSASTGIPYRYPKERMLTSGRRPPGGGTVEQGHPEAGGRWTRMCRSRHRPSSQR